MKRTVQKVISLFLCVLIAAGTVLYAAADDGLTESLMAILIDLRLAAKKRKDFETADKIRNDLKAAGILLEDRLPVGVHRPEACHGADGKSAVPCGIAV